MISTGLLSPEGVNELNAPMVYLAPDRHAFLVLGDGEEPLITWSRSFQLACEQADIHGGTVVAVPIVRDSSWRRPHIDDPAPGEVPVRVSAFPRKMTAQSAGEPSHVCDDSSPCALCSLEQDGYALGRAAAGGGQGSPDGWSSARDGVEGQQEVPVPALVRRAGPFGDPGAPQMPEDPEGALRAAFGGGEGPEVEAAVAAFRTAAQADLEVLERVRAGLIGDEPTQVITETTWYQQQESDR